MNHYRGDGLLGVASLRRTGRTAPCWKCVALTEPGATTGSLAYNDVSLLRQTRQAAHLRHRSQWPETRVDELICDGVLVATPAGSTAYNFSAHGPILPLGSHTIALTP